MGGERLYYDICEYMYGHRRGSPPVLHGGVISSFMTTTSYGTRCISVFRIIFSEALPSRKMQLMPGTKNEILSLALLRFILRLFKKCARVISQ